MVTVRKNGVDTSLSITIPAGGTGVRSDTITSVSFAAGDSLSVEFDASTSNGVLGGVAVTMAYD